MKGCGFKFQDKLGEDCQEELEGDERGREPVIPPSDGF